MQKFTGDDLEKAYRQRLVDTGPRGHPECSYPETVMQRVVVVTGAAGFIGNAVASRLHKDGHKVVALDDFSSGRNLSVEPGLLVVNCDLRSREQVEG